LKALRIRSGGVSRFWRSGKNRSIGLLIVKSILLWVPVMKSKNLEVKKTLIKLDTGKPGILAIWREYQTVIIAELLNHDERTSSEIHNSILSKGIKASRASVISFLNCLVDEGLATFREATGKGGYHRIYALKDRSWTDFNNAIIDRILLKLWEIFPDARARA